MAIGITERNQLYMPRILCIEPTYLGVFYYFKITVYSCNVPWRCCAFIGVHRMSERTASIRVQISACHWCTNRILAKHYDIIATRVFFTSLSHIFIFCIANLIKYDQVWGSFVIYKQRYFPQSIVKCFSAQKFFF